MKKEKTTRLPFELDSTVDDSLVTSRAGVPLVVELFRASGAASAMDSNVMFKSRNRGLKASETAECFFALWSSGGDRCEDFTTLRDDSALAELIGHEILAPNTARDFLDGFHGEDLPLWQAGQKASVPSESSSLSGLALSNRRLLEWAQKRGAEKTATLDVDASIYETGKRSAKKTYEGERGYQPVVAVWAERDLIVMDEFRDGNVPAHSGNERVIRRAVESLPAGVEKIYVRGDSALYEHGVLRYMDDSKIGYAISAVMTAELKAVVESVGDGDWKPGSEESDAYREWAEVEFFPDDGDHRKVGPVARRYIAIRIRKRQGHLFADGTDRRHFAVVTNLDWEGGKILEWSRKRAGTVEHVHDVMKNELAGGCFPSGKFGANAGWFRLSAICYNLLSLLKRETLPGEFWTAKPKRLRFLLLNTVGKVVRHARETLLRVCSEALRELYEMVRTRIYEKQAVLAGD